MVLEQTLLRSEFEKLVLKAYESLPEPVLERIENLDIEVQWQPSLRDLRRAGLRGGSLYGVYLGVPLARRGHYNLVLPDKIIIYQKAHERFADDPAAMEAQVRKTLLHEIAHHLGIEEGEMGRLGLR